ncbi:MAG: hypothetical protein K2Q06_01435, partial [Parvularculaceae bacterium]|nr:hypothetical protein [Parvularculaceae bacterium]
ALLLAASIFALPAAAQEVVPGADAPEATHSAPETPGAAEPKADDAAQPAAPSAEPARPLVMAPIENKADAAPTVLVAPPAQSAGGRAVATAGEHKGFSRVVVNGAAASVAQSGRTVTIALDGARDADITALRGRKSTRVTSARVLSAGAGSKIVLDLACDCRARTMRLDDGRFVVDIYDAASIPQVARAEGNVGAKPNPATSVAEKSASAEAVGSSPVISSPPGKAGKVSVDEARKRMVALLQQAADDGLIAVRPNARELTPRAETVAQPTARPTQPTNASLPSKPPAEAARPAPDVARIDPPAPARATSRGPNACLPDPAFAIDARAFKDDPLGAIADLQKQLQEAEVDEERDVSLKLALGYLSIGFGEEALGA